MQRWKTFHRVYLELDYHVVLSPRLGGFVSCDDLSWEFKGTTQFKPSDWSTKAAKTVASLPALAKRPARLPRVTAKQADLHLHPHIMVEWYPHVLTGIRTLHPMGPNKTMNLVEVLHYWVAAFERVSLWRLNKRLHGNHPKTTEIRGAHGCRP
jgi:choline monooxygenase